MPRPRAGPPLGAGWLAPLAGAIVPMVAMAAGWSGWPGWRLSRLLEVPAIFQLPLPTFDWLW